MIHRVHYVICPIQYDVAVDGEGLKMALKTALHFGHAVSGKSKDQFAHDVRPYLKVKFLIEKLEILKFMI